MPRSVFRNYLETLFAVTLFLAATSSSAGPVESAQPTIDDALIYEIVTHTRPVVLITQLTNNNHILVIIGSTHHRILLPLNDLHVFEQPLENLGHDSIHLKPSTPFLTRWPVVAGRDILAMFAVPDRTGDNIILGDDDKYSASALQLSTGTIETLRKLDGNSAVANLAGFCTFSSAEPAHYFWIYSKSPSFLVEQYFNSDTFDQATDVLQGKSYYICDHGLSSSGQRIRVSSARCQLPIKWNITAGFTNATSVVLVDNTNSVLIFDLSVLTSGQPADVVKIPAEKFWVKWVPPLEPSNRTQMSSTEKPSGTKWTEPTTAKWPVVLVLAIAVPNLLLVLCLITLSIYCLCMSKQSSDNSVFAKPPKVADGSRNKQDHKSVARTARKGGTKEKHGSSHNAANLKTKAARSSTEVKKTTVPSSHSPGKSAIASKATFKVGKTSKSSAVGKSATAVSKASRNGNASTGKRSLAGPTALSSKAARVH